MVVWFIWAQCDYIKSHCSFVFRTATMPAGPVQERAVTEVHRATELVSPVCGVTASGFVGGAGVTG